MYVSLRELKGEGFLVFKHILGSESEAFIFTKNVDGVSLQKHIAKLCGEENIYELLKGEVKA